ncbi:MAG: ABC transporter permease, partial [Oscillospiraceae bacterium]|nr:ABC transporter permease [Oscillospiraceae bacterium]
EPEPEPAPEPEPEPDPEPEPEPDPDPDPGPSQPGTDVGLGIYGMIKKEDIPQIVSDYLGTPAVSTAADAVGMKMMEATIQADVMEKLYAFSKQLTSYISRSFYVDGDRIANAFQFNMTEEEIQRLMMAMSGQSGERSAAANIRSLGYAEQEKPTSMSVYMVDFAAKEEFLAFLDAYNEAMREAEKEEQVIQYTDMTGIMMSSIRTIIDSVSYALIAFVAVSLVVSSIMIGIITYISVMERTKEIGVLRAIGASKRNITQVFNAETFIIGLCSGMLGIGVTLLTLIPGNMLIHHLTDNPDIVAQLPVANAAILIGLSVLLTLIGGFIPAKKAAKKDPVIALRSE